MSRQGTDHKSPTELIESCDNHERPILELDDTHAVDFVSKTSGSLEGVLNQPAKSSWRHLFAFTRWSHALPLVVAVLSSSVTAALKTTLAVVLGRVFDVISDYGSGVRDSDSTLSSISQWSIILVGIGIGNWIANSVFLALWIIYGELQATTVRRDTFKSLLSKNMAWFDSQEQGVASLLVRVQTQTRELQLATSQILGLLICDVMTALASLGVAFYFSWKLTLVLLATLPISTIILSLATRKLEPAIQAQRKELARASKHATAAISAIDLVKIFKGHDQELKKYFSYIQKSAEHYLVQSRCNSIQMGYVAFWVIAIFVVGFWYGMFLVQKGVSPGSILTTFYSTLAAFQGIEALMPHWLVLAKGKSAGAFLKTIASNSEGGRKVRRMGRTVRPVSCAGDIQLSNVSFAYPTNAAEKVLKDSTLFFPAGDMTFIVGVSGSGKSTIGNIIANFYEPLSGDVQVDGESMRVLDESWIHENITLIQQSSVLFNETFFKNIAFGLPNPQTATHQEVLAACDAAMLQSTLAGLPAGLETMVGSEGHDLSGGQKQRLALARARLRNPPVLILDEVTSGLDQVSRSLVMESIRNWRRNKTTIIITHDVSQIEDDDRVYVMDKSYLVQEGFKRDLMKDQDGQFALLASPIISSPHEPGCPEIIVIAPDTPVGLPPDTPLIRSRPTRVADFILDELEHQSLGINSRGFSNRTSLGAAPSHALNLRLSRMWNSAAVSGDKSLFQPDTNKDWNNERQSFSDYISQRFLLSEGCSRAQSRESSYDPTGMESDADEETSRTLLGPLDASCLISAIDSERTVSLLSSQYFNYPPSQGNSIPMEEFNLRHAVPPSPDGLFGTSERRANITDLRKLSLTHLAISSEKSSPPLLHSKKPRKQGSVFTTLRSVWPNIGIREKLIMVFGVIICMIAAAATPAFAYCFAQLLGVMTAPGEKVANGMKWAGIMLGIALVDGLGWGGSRYMLEDVGQAWINKIRTEALRRILQQPRTWFDQSRNSPGRITECLDRNAEEMRNIVGKFVPIMVAVITMVTISIIWALVASWKLCLVALAPLPAVLAAIKGFAVVSGKWETKCNQAAEATSASLTEIFLNIRTVRALTLEGYFTQKYEGLVADTLMTGLKRSLYTCGLYGLYQSMGYALTSLVFYYGTVLLARQKELGVAEVMQVVNLLLFSIGTSAGILSSIPQLTMAQATASQVLGYASMSTEPPEGQRGHSRLDNPLPISMKDLRFAYSKSGLKHVLVGTSLAITPRSCTAIVGFSGCGKSTITSVLMGLRTPVGPATLSFGGISSGDVDVSYIQSQMAYVSQTPFLFPATIAENITYGLPEGSQYAQTTNICRAADAAGLHDWIVSLPLGYGTIVGDGGQSLSGGQAQRLSIARALVRQPKLMVLDEPTSALDSENSDILRRAIHDLILRFGHDMAIVLVTHSRDMMRVANKIIMLGDGGVVLEEGTYSELWDKGGHFASMVRGGQ